MFWKLLGLQALLDSLFDDSWLSLGQVLGDARDETASTEPRHA
jgi:hypothetical protein